jgi:urease beta subunit
VWNVIPGEIITRERDVILNEGRRTARVAVSNQGDRPVQVGSHFHFFETNKLLRFDRETAYGMRLDIPSGTSVRFEPGETKTVQLTALGGRKRVFGLNGLTAGQASPASLPKSLHAAREKGFVE